MKTQAVVSLGLRSFSSEDLHRASEEVTGETQERALDRKDPTVRGLEEEQAGRRASWPARPPVPMWFSLGGAHVPSHLCFPSAQGRTAQQVLGMLNRQGWRARDLSGLAP